MCNNGGQKKNIAESSIPLMSNLNESIQFQGLANGGICTYQMEVANNEENDKLVEIEINKVSNVKVAIDFSQWQSLNSTEIVETGFL